MRALFISSLFAFTLVGCASSSAKQSDKLIEPTETSTRPKKTTRDVLFDAIIEESTARGYVTATESRRFWTLITEYESVSARIRKRRVMSIIVLPKGGALKVVVEYERDAGPEGAPSWEPLESEAIMKKASEEEMELARAIEKRFHHMR